VEYEQLTLDWCYSCGRDEPVPPSGAYLICPECGHVYETADDLLEDYLAQAPERILSHRIPAWADEITFCPLCLHNL